MPLKRKLFWIGLGLLSLLLRWLGSFQPAWIEQYYSRSIFIPIRALFDILFGWLPFPLLYVFVMVMVIWLIKTIRNILHYSAKWKQRIFYTGISFIAFIGALIFAFMFLWGFNYGRLALEDQLGIEPTPLSKEQIWEALQAETTAIVALRSRIPGAKDEALDQRHHPPHLESKLRGHLKTW